MGVVGTTLFMSLCFGLPQVAMVTTFYYCSGDRRVEEICCRDEERGGEEEGEGNSGIGLEVDSPHSDKGDVVAGCQRLPDAAGLEWERRLQRIATTGGKFAETTHSTSPLHYTLSTSPLHCTLSTSPLHCTLSTSPLHYTLSTSPFH